MSEKPIYEPVAIRGNPSRIRGLLAKIKLHLANRGRRNLRDGDVLEIALTGYEETLAKSNGGPEEPPPEN
jgi:hypothetical protein